MKQITIVAENRTGVLDDMLARLAAARINVESADVESMGGQGVVALTVDNYDEAFKLLTHAGYQAVSDEVLVMRIEDKPGALGQVSHRLKEADIGIRSLRILTRGEGMTTVALVTEDNEQARAALGI
jgi:hypothetical protein